MTVAELAKTASLTIITLPDPDREVVGGYAGDLLSWVMGRAHAGDAWVTIMSNLNIVAVASLADPSCIILSEGVSPDEGVLDRAVNASVNVLGSKKDTFALCAQIATKI